MDILGRLNAAREGFRQTDLAVVALDIVRLLTDAIAEIERLRALAGAVSPGPSLRDIRDSKTTGC